MKVAAAILVLLLPGVVTCGQTRRASSSRLPAPRVAEIENTSEVSKTVSCGFYFQLPKKSEANTDRYVFISQVNGREAWMNLDGRDVRLALIRISPYPKERPGARRRIDYRAAGGYRVRVETTVTGLSDENNYEPTRFRVRLTVIRRGRAAVVRAFGSSGC